MKYQVLVHYGELALKGGNRKYFENKLLNNLKIKFKDYKNLSVKKLFGRFLIEVETDNKKQLIKDFQEVPGIANFSFAHLVKSDLKTIGKEVLELLKNEKFKTFRMATNRVDKNFPKKSMEVNEIVGAAVVDKLKKKVSLKKFDLNCELEIMHDQTFIYFEEYQGIGGLPAGVSGKLVCLMSGGIDSPVAAYQMIKRGGEVIFVHFYSYPSTPKEAQQKVEELVQILNKYQLKSKIYFVPFLDIQKQVVDKCPAEYRVVFYRRMMYRLAQEIALKEGAKALVNGESLGQVASQTLENIAAVNQTVQLPVFRPLIGNDKEDIIKIAQKIGTFELSTQDFQDCCSLYVPKHPVTKADLDLIDRVEKEFKYKPLLKKALEKSEVKEYSLY